MKKKLNHTPMAGYKEPAVEDRTKDLSPGQSAAITLKTSAPSAGPSEMDEFMDDLSFFDKEEFRRFRREHPGLSDQEAMSMFKASRGHSFRKCPRL